MKVADLLKGSGRVDVSMYDFSEIGLPANIQRKVLSFEIIQCGLKSLKNCPDIVETDFLADENLFTSLEGGPREVGGRYSIRANKQLVSLKGAPEVINENFYLEDCTSLTNLNGGPSIVKGNFNAKKSGLTSLKGCPKRVEGTFNVIANQLKAIDYLPEYIGGHLYLGSNSIKSIKGIHLKVKHIGLGVMLYQKNDKTPSGLLDIFKIEHPPKEIVTLEDDRVDQIINHYLAMDDKMAAMKRAAFDLIEADLEHLL